MEDLMRTTILFGAAALAAAGLLGCDDDATTTATQGPSGTAGSGAIGGDGGAGAAGGQGGEGAMGGGGGVPGCQDPPATSNARKVDLLVMIDNSRGMRDKQVVLADGIDELLGVFVNPRCLDADGAPVANQPATSADPCPPGSQREHDAVVDLQVGIITSSIGGHGSDACDNTVFPTENDHAHLVSRADPSGSTQLPTWDDKGFLAWDPNQALAPPGSCSPQALASDLDKMIDGVGEVGCGFEAPLESWYRFLVEPDPYDSIDVQNGLAVLVGTDQILVAQRAAFVRPDSVLVVVMLTEENDCSTRDGGQFYLSNQIFAPSTAEPFHLPKPRAACAVDPNDPCCRSCGQPAGLGCDTSQDDCSAPLSASEDALTLRCFDQKRRFGVDFLWPVDRYVDGLTSTVVADRHGNLVQNPLFAQGRSPSDVYLAGIIGVPWQDIARRDSSGAPDLVAGLDADGDAVGGMQSASELVANGVWDLILGNPAAYVPPDDPLMVESIAPRTGQNPVTGDALAPPGAGLLANPINGHEYSIPDNDDLQYACIFELPQPRDCTTTMDACECKSPSNDNPLCQAANGQFGTTQYYAKAYPGRRQLQLLEAVGNQAIVGSICPAPVADPASSARGYRPTFAALAEAVRASLAP
jgi:hypothetical protein